jgi:hypothetical protein
MLGAIRSQDHGFTFSAARASEALTETGDRRRWTHLCNALNRTDIDPQFQGRGADRSGWSLSQFECRFRLFANLFGQIAVMGPELVGDSFISTKARQVIRIELNLSATVRKHQIAASPKHLKQIGHYSQLSGRVLLTIFCEER